jgi:CubicO group peptidase (beta-lactamase class C family)
MKRRDFAIGAAAFGASAGLAGLGRAADLPTATLRGRQEQVERAWREAVTGVHPVLGRSDALLILQDGRIVFERYGGDHGPDVRHVSWSMAKSFTHALVGIGVADGKVDIDRPLTLVRNPDPGLTLRRLLNLTDGLDWHEASYEPEKSDAARMLYGPGRLDGAGYTAAMHQAVKPGTRFNYSTGSFQLAAAELAAHLFPDARDPGTKRRVMADFIQQRLFAPLGMTTALAEFDAAGTFIGGSLVYASARDFARFGELYRQDGMVGGRRLLPEGWVKFARTPTVSPVYGAGFWLETDHLMPKPPQPLLRGRGPRDAFSAQGHEGQVILVIPSRNAVIVRLGKASDGPAAWAGLGDWLNTVIAAIDA